MFFCETIGRRRGDESLTKNFAGKCTRCSTAPDNFKSPFPIYQMLQPAFRPFDSPAFSFRDSSPRLLPSGRGAHPRTAPAARPSSAAGCGGVLAATSGNTHRGRCANPQARTPTLRCNRPSIGGSVRMRPWACASPTFNRQSLLSPLLCGVDFDDLLNGRSGKVRPFLFA